MIVGCFISLADNKTFMFQDDKVLDKCPECGYRLDFFAHNSHYSLRCDDYDLSETFDGQLIGSQAFKNFCDRERIAGIDFLPFERDIFHYHVMIHTIVPFDAIRRGTRFEKRCNTCGNYESIVGMTPSFLKIARPLANGLYRSDLLFASGNEKGPAYFAGLKTHEKMVVAGLRGIHFEPALGNSGVEEPKTPLPFEREVSGGRDLHPPALPKPDVSLSTHPAPIIPERTNGSSAIN